MMGIGQAMAVGSSLVHAPVAIALGRGGALVSDAGLEGWRNGVLTVCTPLAKVRY